jgi:hypothetical protein
MLQCPCGTKILCSKGGLLLQNTRKIFHWGSRSSAPCAGSYNPGRLHFLPHSLHIGVLSQPCTDGAESVLRCGKWENPSCVSNWTTVTYWPNELGTFFYYIWSTEVWSTWPNYGDNKACRDVWTQVSKISTQAEFSRRSASQAIKRNAPLNAFNLISPGV